MLVLGQRVHRVEGSAETKGPHRRDGGSTQSKGPQNLIRRDIGSTAYVSVAVMAWNFTQRWSFFLRGIRGNLLKDLVQVERFLRDGCIRDGCIRERSKVIVGAERRIHAI
jgi:hypothetical protein